MGITMKKTVTFVGNGNMALSIAQGLKDDYEIEVVGRNRDKLEKFETQLGVKINKYALDGFDMCGKIIVLCVKPYNIEAMKSQLQGNAEVLYSVLAGTSIETIKENIHADAYVRAMPNLGASVQSSMTTLTGDKAYQEEAITLFNAIGTARWLDSEKELDIATGLTGSGPAYLALIAEALADGAVKQGLKRPDALAITNGLFAGFGKLIQEIHPALLKDAVMSPGGTTAAGYGALEKGNVRSSCMDAIEAAYKRAQEL